MDEFMDRFFQGWTSNAASLSTPLDIVEQDNEFVITAELPGISRDDIDITLHNDVLTISGEKRAENEEEGKSYYHVERSYGSFHREVHLPSSVDGDNVTADYADGLLKLRVPKTEAAKPKQITIG